jgi:VIT1/CCC1 family predicted Fe2+/Mn2+ transporter
METSRSHHGDHHRDVQGGRARASVFGASDGLLTNVSLTLGVAGAHTGAAFVRLAGLAGLVAGAFSMGAGEYISVTAQKELIERELDIEKQALLEFPEEERRELIASYVGRGVRREVAEEVATAIMSDPDLALEAHSREELGVNPGETGRPWTAAISSFISFSVGAAVPLFPWLFASGTVAVGLSIALSAAMALGVGAVLGQVTGRSRVRIGLRQFAITAVVAAITFGVGSFFGVHGVG